MALILDEFITIEELKEKFIKYIDKWALEGKPGDLEAIETLLNQYTEIIISKTSDLPDQCVNGWDNVKFCRCRNSVSADPQCKECI